MGLVAPDVSQAKRVCDSEQIPNAYRLGAGVDSSCGGDLNFEITMIIVADSARLPTLIRLTRAKLVCSFNGRLVQSQREPGTRVGIMNIAMHTHIPRRTDQ